MLQCNWLGTFHATRYVPVVSSSSYELKEEDDEFFNQQPPEDNRTFMHLIWEEIINLGGNKKNIQVDKGEEEENWRVTF